MTEKDLTTDMLDSFRSILEVVERKQINIESASYDFIIEECEKSIGTIINYQKHWYSKSEEMIPLIVKTVCDFYCVDENKLNNLDRRPYITNVRQVSMYLCRTLANSTLIVMADKFERGHATVIHSINKIKELISVNKRLKREILEITKLIENAPQR